MDIIIHNQQTGKQEKRRISPQLRIGRIFIGYVKSQQFANETMGKIKKMRNIIFAEDSMWITICPAKYGKFKYLQLVHEAHIRYKKWFQNQTNIKHIHNHNETFTPKELEYLLRQVKQENKMKQYKNVILTVMGYGSLNNNDKDYFRFTNGLKLFVIDFESYLQSLISPKIKTLFSWELYSSKISKECGYSECNASILTINNNTKPGKIQILTLKLCSQCKNRYYCCRKHQKLDWNKNHRYECC